MVAVYQAVHTSFCYAVTIGKLNTMNTIQALRKCGGCGRIPTFHGKKKKSTVVDHDTASH